MTALKNIPSLIGGAAVLAAATIGLTVAIASAKEWDIGAYDKCNKTRAGTTYECCLISDGDWEDGKCVAPAPLTQVPDSPEVTPQIVNGTLPTVATNAPATSTPGTRAPGSLPSGGVAP